MKKLHTSSEILSFFHGWVLLLKCEFDTDVKIGNNYHHHDGEQVGFYKKVHIKTQQKALYCKKQTILIYLTKTALKRTSNAIFNMKIVDLDESWLSR